LAGSSDKRSALRIFVSSGSFADKHYAGVGLALARDGVRSQRSQLAFAALVNFGVDFFELLLRLGDSRTIVLLLWFRQIGFTLGCEAGEKLLHFKVLANNFIHVHVFFHRDRL
jgi:hypothetical protein